MFNPGDVIRYNDLKYPEWKKNLYVVLDFDQRNNSALCISLSDNDFMIKGKKAVFIFDRYFEKVEIEVKE